MPTSLEMLAPSFLDRLLDAATEDEERAPRGAAVSAMNVQQMTAAIGRDLEDLLNTRATYQGLLTMDSPLTGTILTFGLTDIG